jgi:hypothetical protein
VVQLPQALLVLLLQSIMLGMHVSLQMLLPCPPLIFQLLPVVNNPVQQKQLWAT